MAENDEMERRAAYERNLLACIQRGDRPAQRWPTQEERDLARNAAQALWLRDERIRALEAWLKAEADDELGPEDAVHRLLPEKASIEQVKRASEAANVQFHVSMGSLVLDEHLGEDEERDRLARAFEALRRLDVEVRDRASKIFSANRLDGHGFAASVAFTYVPEWDKTKRGP